MILSTQQELSKQIVIQDKDAAENWVMQLEPKVEQWQELLTLG